MSRPHLQAHFATAKSLGIQVLFDDDHLKQKLVVERKAGRAEMFIFGPTDPIKGRVFLTVFDRKPVMHNGIRIVLTALFETLGNPRPQLLLETAMEPSGQMDFERVDFQRLHS